MTRGARTFTLLSFFESCTYPKRKSPYTVLFVGAIGADSVREGYHAALVASAPVGDAEVMPGLGPVPLGRWQSAIEER